jgi:hypothetical protein
LIYHAVQSRQAVRRALQRLPFLPTRLAKFLVDHGKRSKFSASRRVNCNDFVVFHGIPAVTRSADPN